MLVAGELSGTPIVAVVFSRAVEMPGLIVIDGVCVAGELVEYKEVFIELIDVTGELSGALVVSVVFPSVGR